MVARKEVRKAAVGWLGNGDSSFTEGNTDSRWNASPRLVPWWPPFEDIPRHAPHMKNVLPTLSLWVEQNKPAGI